MPRLKDETSPVVLIGDVVDSRLHPDRQQLHDALEAAIVAANSSSTPLDPLVITLGDEFQGVFATVGDALTASFHVRAHLHPLADVRFGVGRGEVSTLDAARGIHDGPGYWAARDAGTVEDRSHRLLPRRVPGRRGRRGRRGRPTARHGDGPARRPRLSGLHGWVDVDDDPRHPRRTHGRPEPARRRHAAGHQRVRGVAAGAARRRRRRPRRHGRPRAAVVTWLSVVLVGLGVADLVRSSSWRRSRLAAHVAAPVVVAALAWVAGLTSWPDVLALALALAGCAAWMEVSRHAQR